MKLRTLIIVLLLIPIAFLLKGSAVSQPPVMLRQWAVTVTGVPQTVDLRAKDPTQPVQGSTRSVIFVNDGISGGDDIYVGVNGTTAASPTNGAQIITIKPTERAAYDVQLTTVSVLSSAGDSTALRIQASY